MWICRYNVYWIAATVSQLKIILFLSILALEQFKLKIVWRSFYVYLDPFLYKKRIINITWDNRVSHSCNKRREIPSRWLEFGNKFIFTKNYFVYICRSFRDWDIWRPFDSILSNKTVQLLKESLATSWMKYNFEVLHIRTNAQENYSWKITKDFPGICIEIEFV